MIDINIVVSGAAGQGVQTVGTVLAKTAHRAGYCVFSWQEYESRIRGGSNSYRIRISEEVKNSPMFAADVFLPLDSKSKAKYISIKKKDGILVDEEDEKNGSIHIPFKNIANEKFGDKIYSNTVAVGALAAVIGIEIDLLNGVLSEVFGHKSDEIIQKNRKAVQEGYDLAEAQCEGVCPWRLKSKKQRGYLVTGSDAMALGSAAGGCRFIAAYPMTPATGIITYLSKHKKKLRIFSEQAEDEIAAINMAIGASYAGVRAMTATSGGGFALMTEGVSLAGITETPVVIILAQRPGPATGLPTRTEQGDLLFAVHSGHGEFPKMVLAPSDPREGFHCMVRAFETAEKYQIPVIVMSDQFMASSAYTIENFDLDRIKINNYITDPKSIKDYHRYELTQNGISPRLYPGQSAHLVCSDSDEHDEAGRITEDLEFTRNRMVEKRLNKGKLLREEVQPPESYLMNDAETVFISWGSSKNAVFEAIDALRARDQRIGGLHFTEIWPLPIFNFPKDKSYVMVENNATSQLGMLLKGTYDLIPKGYILRYDGYPLDSLFILEGFKNV